jgi:hypothetical protein
VLTDSLCRRKRRDRRLPVLLVGAHFLVPTGATPTSTRQPCR